MGERLLYLVRHGQLDMRAFAENQVTAGLTAIGREQARLTAKRLRSLDVRAIYCSSIRRARETGDIISKEFPNIAVRSSRLLWELPTFGPAADEPWETWQVVLAKQRRRAERAFMMHVRPARERQRIELLVSHGNLIRYFVCRALGIEPESWSCLGTSHCGITRLWVSSQNKVVVLSYNEVGHLPSHLR